MQYDELVQYVERVGAGGLDRRKAQRALGATLRTLAECLPADVAQDLAEQLPQQMRAHLTRAPGEPETLSLSEFLGRVAEREALSPSEALHHARAVLDALAQAVTGHELHDVRAHLPDELQTLFTLPAAAGWPETHRHRPHA